MKGDNTSLLLQDLTHKLAMLMVLTRLSRSVDLAKLSLDHKCYSSDGVTFLPTELAKQSRQLKHGMEFFFPCYPQDDRLCPVLTLKEYKACTTPIRGGGANITLFLG